MSALEIETLHGPARARLHLCDEPRGALVLGHGAGGGVDAPDLAAARRAALEVHVAVALVEQPYRVARRRSPAPAAQLDAAWTVVVAELAAGPFAGLPIVTGGRSSGARVACRTSAATGAAGVVCLAFPVHPPGRPAMSRLDELRSVGVPTLVVQGRNDPFGMPPRGRGRKVVQVEGDHSLRGSVRDVERAVRTWLPSVVGAGASRRGASSPP